MMINSERENELNVGHLISNDDLQTMDNNMEPVL